LEAETDIKFSKAGRRKFRNFITGVNMKVNEKWKLAKKLKRILLNTDCTQVFQKGESEKLSLTSVSDINSEETFETFSDALSISECDTEVVNSDEMILLKKGA
jgi:hypothetical protein